MRLFVAFLPMCFSWCNAQTHLTINLWQDLANLSWAFAKLFGYNLLWVPRGLNIFISLNIRSGSLLSFIWVCPKVWGPSFRLAKKPWTGEFQWSWYVLNTHFTWCPQERMKFTMNFRSFMFFSTYYCMVFYHFFQVGDWKQLLPYSRTWYCMCFSRMSQLLLMFFLDQNQNIEIQQVINWYHIISMDISSYSVDTPMITLWLFHIAMEHGPLINDLRKITYKRRWFSSLLYLKLPEGNWFNPF